MERGTEEVGSQASGLGGVSGGPAEGGAAVHPLVVRERGGGFTQYWTGGGDVRGRDVTEAALLASGVPDPGTVERAFRDASLGGGAEAAFRAAR